MQLPPLTPARITRRYKRFLADVRFDDGEVATAHCPNTGAMSGCWAPEARVELSHSDNPKRKLAWTLERVDMGAGWVGVNTHRVNSVIAEGITQGAIDSLAHYPTLTREPPLTLVGHPKSRLDILLQGGGLPDAYIEIKCATLLDGAQIRFPDAVSARGLKHLELLEAIVQRGQRGVMIYAVNRPEGEHFAPADRIDPRYGARLREVVRAGVEVLALRIAHHQESMVVAESIPVDLSPSPAEHPQPLPHR